MEKSRQVIEIGALFGIPLSEQGYCFGQLLEDTSDALGSVYCALFSLKLSDLDSAFDLADLKNRLISTQFVTPDLYLNGHWRRLETLDALVDHETTDFYKLKQSGYRGATILGSQIIVEFLSAWHGQLPWNLMFDPKYFDKLLLSGVVRPNSVVFEEK